MVVFISGLSHSGSTLLNMMLGSHSRCVGLGEAFRTIAPGVRGIEKTLTNRCTCGAAPKDCKFWGRAIDGIPQAGEFGQKEQYELIFRTFGEVMGSDTIAVDASKYRPPLKALSEMGDVDLRVLHIVRDVRSFAISQIDNVERKVEKRARGKRLRISDWFKYWYEQNNRIVRLLEKCRIPTLRLGYEELALAPDLMSDKICAFLGVDTEASMLSPDVSTNHMIRGNWRMAYRSQALKENRMKIRYDYRWFQRDEWMRPALFSPRIMRLNRKLVYSNDATDLRK
jgi:hypothetical protein